MHTEKIVKGNSIPDAPCAGMADVRTTRGLRARGTGVPFSTSAALKVEPPADLALTERPVGNILGKVLSRQ